MTAPYYSDSVPAQTPKQLDRRIVALALPALGALIAEPAFLLLDTALIGHLGAEELAGIGIGQVVLHTITGLLIFLAYATTPRVARLLGSGNKPAAIQAGLDGIWLALGVGVLLLVFIPLAHPITSVFGAEDRVTHLGSSYLAISVLGLPAMLMVLAATGLLRGLQDTKTPLVVASIGFAANGAMSVLFIYGFGWGVPGSAIGTVIAQWGMAAFFIWFSMREARRNGISLWPTARGVRASIGFGGWLFLRALWLRLALLATTFIATNGGTEVLAATQIAFTLFSTLAFALDALAIAGQAMIGKALGASDAEETRAITRRLIRWGVWCGVVVGVLLAASSPALGFVFTSHDGVLAILPWALLALAIGQPIAGVVFVLDGVLIGAGDARYLAWTGIVNLGVYLPLLALTLLTHTDAVALLTIWAAFSLGYLGARLVTLIIRARGDRWMVLGA